MFDFNSIPRSSCPPYLKIIDARDGLYRAYSHKAKQTYEIIEADGRCKLFATSALTRQKQLLFSGDAVNALRYIGYFIGA